MKNTFSNLRKSTLFVLYVIAFVFTFSSALPSYINSSFLSSLTSQQLVGVIYAVCALLTLIAFVYTPRFLKKYGNYTITMVLANINTLTFLGLAFSHNVYFLLACFTLNYLTAIIISFCLDIFVEHNSPTKTTGEIRSIYLTSINLAWLVSPWLSGLLVGVSAYWKVYLAATAVMIPTTVMLSYNLKNFVDPEYREIQFFSALKKVWHTIDIKCIFIASFLLQFFFAWMVIYTPIYLNKYVGFDWVSIGLIFTIMLVPFVIIQIPFGELADKKLGEKEMLCYGFIIMAISTGIIPLIHNKDFFIWALLLFMTRIGAAIVEEMCDIYFFKKITDKDVDVISFYRTATPLANVIAPIVAILFLWHFAFGYMFYALGFLMLFGLRYTLALTDTVPSHA